MTRAACFLIVLSLAGAPADTLVCLAQCTTGSHSTPADAGCHRTAPRTPAIASSDLECGLSLEGSLFLKEDRNASGQQTASHGTPAARLDERGDVTRGRAGFLPLRTRTDRVGPTGSTVLRI